MQRYKTKLDLV